MDASDPAYGWGGLIVQGAGASATLTHTEILHGGRAGGGNQRYCNVAAVNGGQLTIAQQPDCGQHPGRVPIIQWHDLSVRRFSHAGRQYNCEHQPSGVTFYSIFVTGANSTLEMTNNTFSGNSLNAVLLGSDGLAGTRNTLRPQPGLAGYDIGVPYAAEPTPCWLAASYPSIRARSCAGFPEPGQRDCFSKVQGAVERHRNTNTSRLSFRRWMIRSGGLGRDLRQWGRGQPGCHHHPQRRPRTGLSLSRSLPQPVGRCGRSSFGQYSAHIQ